MFRHRPTWWGRVRRVVLRRARVFSFEFFFNFFFHYSYEKMGRARFSWTGVGVLFRSWVLGPSWGIQILWLGRSRVGLTRVATV